MKEGVKKLFKTNHRRSVLLEPVRERVKKREKRERAKKKEKKEKEKTRKTHSIIKKSRL